MKKQKIVKTESILGRNLYEYRGHWFGYDRHMRLWFVMTQQFRPNGDPIRNLMICKADCLKCIDWLIETNGESEE